MVNAPTCDYKQSPSFTAPVVSVPYRVPSILGRITLWALGCGSYFLWMGFIMASDLPIFLLNCFAPNVAPLEVVPAAFWPAQPPPFGKMPFTWLVCKLAHLLGEDHSPTWVWEWSHWEGIGHHGKWSKAVAPGHGDSRSACPALNAMANHGILPKNGRHITPQQLVAALARTYGMSFSIANQLLAPMYPIWEGRGWFDLGDLDVHGAIEHDASLTREDLNSPYPESRRRMGQSIPSQRKIDLYFPKDAPAFTADNFSRALAHVRKESRDLNGQYNMNFMQHLFGSGNTALILAIMGPQMSDVRPWLGSEGGVEQFAPGWTPKTTSYAGISIAAAQKFTQIIESGVVSVHGPRMQGWKTSEDGWKALKLRE